MVPPEHFSPTLLDHPTISREHATIFWNARGAVIRCDTSKSVVAVEGRPVACGSEVDLVDGVLLQLGELTFRFRMLKEPDARLRGPKLNIHSLGVLQVLRGQETIPEKSWRTNNVRWLLARVALDWGRPVPTDLLLELFWPDLPVASSKNNLNFSLSTLRAVLRSSAHPEVDYFIRTRNTLQLHPDLLGEHDYLLLQEALMSARQLHPGAACNYWKKALQLYRGPYLDGCFMDWAQEVRQRTHADVLEGGRALLGHLHSIQDWEAIVAVAPQVLGLDACCQASSAQWMRAQIERGNPHEAFRIYETCVQNLDRELGVGPGPEVKETYDLALSRFPE
ncbi:MAG: FHA domain-containing protein [Candidatus Eremiobacteraeota bacterium]|nr:FHA domain-containing protein [Candidatus Eremiobacteraeota bacterium]